MTATSQSCLPNGILFSNQAAVDNFQVNYPGCTEIEGNVIINGSDISNLNGLNVLTSIGYNLVIGSISQSGMNPNLTSLTGLDNVTFIGGNLYIQNNLVLENLAGLGALTTVTKKFIVSDNSVLEDLSGINNLTTVGKEFSIQDNFALASLSGLENLASVGGDLIILNNDYLTDISGLAGLTILNGQLIIMNNNSLTSLEGLENVVADSITGVMIRNNPSLSDCQLQSICSYLSNPGGIVWINFNSSGCNSAIELSVSCDIASPCLPNGHYICTSQSDVDNFSIVYPGCTDLAGDLAVYGDDISNLNGISTVTSIENILSIRDCYALSDLSDLSNLTFVGGFIWIEENEALESLHGLEGLTSTYGLQIQFNNQLLNLSGLDNLVSTGTLNIGDNPRLINLEGLNNLETVNGSLTINYNDSLQNLTALSNLTLVQGGVLVDFNPRLTSLAGLDSVDAMQINSLDIHHNDKLSDCAIKSICDFLINSLSPSYFEANAHDCESEEIVISKCTVGSLEDKQADHQFVIYPNPATSYCVLQNNAPIIKGLLFTLIDVHGRQLLEQEIYDPVSIININGLPSGVFYVRIITEQQTYVQKLVKQ